MQAIGCGRAFDDPFDTPSYIAVCGQQCDRDRPQTHGACSLFIVTGDRFVSKDGLLPRDLRRRTSLEDSVAKWHRTYPGVEGQMVYDV